MNERIMVIGGGGHSRSVIDCIRRAGDTVIGVLDDRLEAGTQVLGAPVLGRIEVSAAYPDWRYVIAVGDSAVRQRIAGRFQGKWYTAVHPAAVIAGSAALGPGTVVMANAVINACAVVGAHCIVNTGAIVEHDVQLGDFVHICPGAVVAGGSTVGVRTQIGVGAVVSNQVSICPDVTVGAGAVVVQDITAPGTYVGIPVRKIR